jgi:hypothetical protein
MPETELRGACLPSVRHASQRRSDVVVSLSGHVISGEAANLHSQYTDVRISPVADSTRALKYCLIVFLVLHAQVARSVAISGFK